MNELTPEDRIALANAPPDIITMEELMNAVEVVRQKEDRDRASTNSFLGQTTSSLREPLLRWAGVGFPDAYMLTSVELTPPSKCSDGVVRNMVDYVLYLTGKTIQDWFVEINTKVSGLRLEPSLPIGSIQMWVYKRA